IRKTRRTSRRVTADRIADVVQAPLRLRRLGFLIGESGETARTPVDDVVPAVNQPLLVQPDECLAHCARQIRLEREACALPVARAANGAQLLEDRRARAVDEIPDALDERLATEVVARLPLCCKLSLHHVLRGDAG